MSDYIHDHPELGNEEHEAARVLTSFLAEHGFQVECPFEGFDTGFRATFDSKKEGPAIGYICEYDALPEIGHGCGHNMIGTMSAGAAVTLSKVVNETGGRVVVVGTPAEETNGAKVHYSEIGVFDELDAAMMVHPADYTKASGSFNAIYPIQFTYRGQTAHAAACPEKGINALNSVIQLFNGIDALRQHVTPDVRMHGIITKGGVAANVVPDEAVAQFYFRAETKETLETVLGKVRTIAQGAAMMTGAVLEMETYELAYDNLVTNEALSSAFNSNLKELGITSIKDPVKSGSSSDIGNVSHRVPTIHPYIGIKDCACTSHTREMAAATKTEFAHERLCIGCIALAQTGYDIITRQVVLR